MAWIGNTGQLCRDDQLPVGDAADIVEVSSSETTAAIADRQRFDSELVAK
jgi:hypothetical protein